MATKMEANKKAIQNTLIYSDIFTYPLTFEQLYTFLISPQKITRDVVKISVQSMKHVIEKNGYYSLDNNNILLREKRQRYHKEKLEKAIRIAHILKYIPTIYLIGISGSVAMQNADKDDDIDLFIITKKETVWISRLLIVTCLRCIGVLRTKNMKRVHDKICVNMLIDETAMVWKKENQDIYTAHEIAQMVPLIERNQMYTQFMSQNIWIHGYMPHVGEQKKSVELVSPDYVVEKILVWVLALPLIEMIARILQKMYMTHHTNSETISPSVLAFHPINYRQKTIALYNRRINEEI